MLLETIVKSLSMREEFAHIFQFPLQYREHCGYLQEDLGLAHCITLPKESIGTDDAANLYASKHRILRRPDLTFTYLTGLVHSKGGRSAELEYCPQGY